MHVTLVGVGGVGSIIALRLGLSHDLHIIDGDIYEPQNSFRQPLALVYPDTNKASAHSYHLNSIIELMDPETAPAKTTVTPTMLAEDQRIPMTELIIAAVDNRNGRNLARMEAVRQSVPLIIAANEKIDAEASLFMPKWDKTPLDPWVTWPQLWEKELPPEAEVIHCTDPRMQELAPQTPVANMAAAMGAMWLLEMFAMRKGAIDFYTPIRFSSSMSTLKSKRPCDLLTEEQWTKILQ